MVQSSHLVHTIMVSRAGDSELLSLNREGTVAETNQRILWHRLCLESWHRLVKEGRQSCIYLIKILRLTGNRPARWIWLTRQWVVRPNRGRTL